MVGFGKKRKIINLEGFTTRELFAMQDKALGKDQFGAALTLSRELTRRRKAEERKARKVRNVVDDGVGGIL